MTCVAAGKERQFVLDNGAFHIQLCREQSNTAINVVGIHRPCLCADVEHRRSAAAELRRYLPLIQRSIGECVVIECGEDAHQVACIVNVGPIEQDKVLRRGTATYLITAGPVAFGLHAGQQLDGLDDVPLTEQYGCLRHLGHIYFLHAYLRFRNPALRQRKN